MAIDETELQPETVGRRAEADGQPEPPSRYNADDFRLRLDSPLFHRDPGLSGGAADPQLRELIWENVLSPPSPTACVPRTGGAPAVAPTVVAAVETSVAATTLPVPGVVAPAAQSSPLPKASS